jgi:histidinol-phosphate aminotransferase
MNIFISSFIIIILLSILYNLTKKNIETFASNNDYYKNKVVIITGSTNGIGLSLAKTFSKTNCKLVIHGRDETRVKNTVALLNKSNKNILGIVADLSDESNFDAVIQKTIEKFNKIDILINNIINRSGSNKIIKKEYKDWKMEMNVNINSIFYLTKKVVENMRYNKIKGKIINISSNETKERSTKVSSGTQILSKTFIERMSELLSEETENDKISIGVIRIDSGNYVSDKLDTKSLKNGIIKRTYEKINNFTNMFYDNPDYLTDMFLDIIKLPHQDLNGKVYSTSAYKEDPELSKIVPSYQLLMNHNLYKKYSFTKNKKEGGTYLTKQNPYGVSPKIQKFIKTYDLNKSIHNVNYKYNSKLSKILADKLKINKKNIVFYKTEYDALKKIFTTFITKYSNIFTLYPNNEILEVLSNELKLNLKYTVYNVNGKSIQPNYTHILNNLNSKTKIIYLTSPNLLTGQSIKQKEFNTFLEKLPNNIIIIIHQSMIDFVEDNKDNLDALNYLNKNVIIIRSFSNFYGYENLELSYVITNKKFAKLLNESNIIINQIDTFNENLAIQCINDKLNNNKLLSKIKTEKKRIYNLLTKSDIPYFPSETNYILINPTKEKQQIMKDFEKDNIILEESDLNYNDYWSLPLSTPKINNKIMNSIITIY